MAMQRRRTGRGRPAGDRSGARDEFIAAARRLVARGEALDARSVAREAGRGLGTLTHHFRSGGMHELRSALAARGYRDLEQQLRLVQLREKDAEAGLRAMATTVARFMLNETPLGRLMVSQSWDTEAAAAADSQRNVMREQLLRCQATGRIRQGDPERVQRTGRAVFYGIMLQVLEGVMTKREALALTSDVLDDLFDGVRAR
jgi:AcrR family transcriptional regulator